MNKTFFLAAASILSSYGALSSRADTEISTNVALSGTAFGLPFNTNLSLDDDFSVRDYSVFNDTRRGFLGGNFGRSLGSVARSGRTLGQSPFDIGLVPDRARTLSFGVPTGTAFTTLLAGRAQIENAPNSFDNTNFFGARVSHPIGDDVLGSVAFLRANDAGERTGRDIAALSLTWTPNVNRRLTGEIARSKGGTALQINGGWRNKRTLVFAGVRRADDRFLLLDSSRIEQRNGGYVYLDYALSPRVNVIGASQRFSDGARRRLRDDNLRFEYSKRNQRAALYAFNRRRSGFRVEDPLEDFFALEGRGIGASASQNFGRTRLSIGALRFQNEREGATDSNGDGTQLSLGARHNLRDGRTRLFANTTLRREDNDAFAGGERRSAFAQAGVERRFGRRGPTLSAAVDTLSRRSNGDTTRSSGLRLGAYASLSENTSFSVSWRTPFSSSSGFNDNDRVFLGISHRFGDSQSRFALEEQRLLSRVRGRVFEDRNLNGAFDMGEVGLADVRVQTANGSRSATTETDGTFALDNLVPGAQAVRLVVKTIPIEYSIARDEFAFEGRAGRITRLDVPVVRGGRVGGVVFRDINRNGVRDADETVLPNVVVVASGSSIIAFADSEGRFSFNDLPPRLVDLTVNLDSIPKTSGEEWEQTRIVQSAIPSGNQAADVQIGVAIKPRETVTTFQGNTMNGAKSQN